jgi:hypothetical protein
VGNTPVLKIFNEEEHFPKSLASLFSGGSPADHRRGLFLLAGL